MSYLPTFWQSADGNIFSEDTLITRLLAGECAGRAVILEDYQNLGARLPLRHPALKVIHYDDWITGVITAIQAGNSAGTYLNALFHSYESICLPDMDLIHGKDATIELLVQAMLETLPKTNIVILGDQLSMLAPYLLELLEGRSLHYTICRDA